MKRDDKRQLRKLKRDVKKAGNKKRRSQQKRSLSDNPAEAHWFESSVGKLSSESLNGLDRDSTRRRPSE